MSKTTTNRITKTIGRNRVKAGVLAAGFGASMALGAGVAIAADSGADDADVFAASAASDLAHATRQQADHQGKEAAAKKKADERAAEAKAKASRDAERKAKSWQSPVSEGAKLSADFGNSGDRWAHKHSGQDFAVPTGTSVESVHGGTVVKAGGNGAGDGPAYGNAIVIKHGNGTYSQYAHLSKVNVKPGQTVKTGQEIAKSGDTGNSSGPHLHFEIRHSANYGSAVEPVKILKEHGVHL
ncbi:M23 family metallopeptidase [Streptomyces daliensis]|uniref:M23 family metallopeptidase n=1 Tax=Streptomyces daliensis TaxID=299421 RepID=A0A8T4IWD7_9ACTN|nr:M23 family metallopeptidase [Streptomyces daliensis]